MSKNSHIPRLDTLIEYFYHWEKKTPDNPFLKQPEGPNWKVLSYGEAGQEARRIATALSNLGLEKGDHIAIMSKNCYHWILADLAIMMGGFVSVPFYATLPKKSLTEVLELSDAKAIFTGKMEDWGDREEGIPEGIIRIKFPQYKGNAVVPNGHEWNTLLAENEPLVGTPSPDPESLWTILFTSGTTGTPKGVMHTHKTPANITKGELESDWLGLFKAKTQRFFSFLPLNHVAERMGVELSAISSGGSMSFAESLATFAKNLQDTQPTMLFAVPRIWTKFYQGVLAKMPQEKMDRLFKIPIVSGIVKKKIRKGLGLSEINVAATGAAITPAYLKNWYKSLGIHLVEAYGMTEVAGSITNSPMTSCPADSVGKSIPAGEVRIDPDTGEILMKTEYMMTGYYKAPEATASVLQEDGWLHSGDRGTIDENGYLRVVGRVKDAFKTSKGQYITPNPLEEKLAGNEYIEQVCIAGLGIPQPIALINLSEAAKGVPKEQVETSLRNSLKKLNDSVEKYKRVSTVIIDNNTWDESNQLLTPTLKVRRGALDDCHGRQYGEWHEHSDDIVWCS